MSHALQGLLYQNASLLYTTVNNVSSCCVRSHAPRNKCQQVPTTANIVGLTIWCLVASVCMGLNKNHYQKGREAQNLVTPEMELLKTSAITMAWYFNENQTIDKK